MKEFPTATRQLEYVAVFNVEFRTQQGPAFAFFAVDAYSKYVFNLSADPDDKPETVLRKIYFLMEDPMFEKHIKKGFTLVFAKYQELEDRINKIIAPVNGKVMFDELFCKYLSLDLMNSLSKSLGK